VVEELLLVFFISPRDVVIFEFAEREVSSELFVFKSNLDFPLVVREEDLNFVKLPLGSFKDIELVGVLGDGDV